jgi:hypothetical protein
VAETEAPLVELLEEIRPLARQLAVVLVRQELAGLTASLNGAVSATDAEMVLARPQLPQETTNAQGQTSLRLPRPSTVPATKQCRICGQTKAATRVRPWAKAMQASRREGEKRRANGKSHNPPTRSPIRHREERRKDARARAGSRATATGTSAAER